MPSCHSDSDKFKCHNSCSLFDKFVPIFVLLFSTTCYLVNLVNIDKAVGRNVAHNSCCYFQLVKKGFDFSEMNKLWFVCLFLWL